MLTMTCLHREQYSLFLCLELLGWPSIFILLAKNGNPAVKDA